MAKKPAKRQDDPRAVPIEEAIERIGRGKHVHTFMQGGGALIGADHSRSDLIAAMKKYGVEEAGDQARAMKHTLVIREYGGHGPLFIEASEK